MYITVNDVIGEKMIDLSYPIHSTARWGKEIAVFSMHNSNFQILLHRPIKVLSIMGKKIRGYIKIRDRPLFLSGGYHFWDLQTIFFKE